MGTRKLELELMKEEYWWGGATSDGVNAPFGGGPCSRDLQDLFYNQGVPLLISNKGRFIWCDSPFTFTFKNGRLVVESSSTDIESGEGHGNLREVFKFTSGKFFPPSGRYPDELAFLAPQYNTWIEMFYGPGQEKVIRYAQAILGQGMPPGILIIDDNWMKDYGDWNFSKEKFPEPKGMVEDLHALGFKVMLWVCPYISPDSAVFRKLEKEGLLLLSRDGTPAIRKWWNGYSAVIDYTDEKAVKWFTSQLDSLVENYKIDGFKFDAGDPSGLDASDWLKDYTWRNLAYQNYDTEAYGKIGLGYDLSEYRACWKCGGTHLIQRQKDKRPVWVGNGLDSLIPNGLLQGLVGYPFNCPDMVGGGMEGDMSSPDFKFDQELFVRFLQCSAFFPILQFSVAPWRVLDKKHLAYCLDIVHLRQKFAKDIVNIARCAAETGEPIIRHMEYQFPGRGYERVDQQFMLGDKILVAPVVEKGASRKRIVFPEGIWSGDDGSIVKGPVEKEVDAPLSRLPYFIRRDS